LHIAETFIYDCITIGSVGTNTNIHRRARKLPQVYIRDHVYDAIIKTGIKTREEIRDYVNAVVSDATKQKKSEESKDE